MKHYSAVQSSELIFNIYMSGLSCSTWNLRCVMQALSLWHMDFLVLSQAQQLSCVGSRALGLSSGSL